ncbi:MULTISPECIES: ATP-binding protein [unclassified Streptomyces]|uniref:ATP-binding protein n=1 Tax=Streptomyces sp. NPDC005955 TaxID=3364738 RepID=UPI0036C680C6
MHVQWRSSGRATRAEFVLPKGRASPRRARWFIRALLAQGPDRTPGQLQDAQLVVSELVANATRAARRPCRLSLHVNDRELTVQVQDDSPGRPVLRPPSASAESGRGLALVHALSRHLSVVDDRRGGKTVRAVLALD